MAQNPLRNTNRQSQLKINDGDLKQSVSLYDIDYAIMTYLQDVVLPPIEENGTASFSTTIQMSTTKDNVSPVIDLSRCSATLVSNVIDGNSSDAVPETTPEIGSASAKYVTKQIKLNQPCSHFRILFDANIPNEAWVDIYYKTGLQSTDFSSQSYTKLTSANMFKDYTYTENPRQFYEAEARLDTTDFDIVQVKIIMKSTNSSKVPRVKALRVIAYA